MLSKLISVDEHFLNGCFHDPVARVNILGVDMECLTFNQMRDAFACWLEDRSRHALRVPLLNAAGSVAALRDPRVMRCYREADIRFMDSMPYTALARRLTGKPVDRMYGPDVFHVVCGWGKERPLRFFLVGGVPGAAEKMAKYAEDGFPGVEVVGISCPPFRPPTAEEDDALVEAITAAKPDYVWIGLGAPKQDLWIEDHHQRLRGCILIGVGAAFDFFSGRVRQAPRWIQRSGFEWLYRLSKDWRRLLGRYTRDNLLFLYHFLRQILGADYRAR